MKELEKEAERLEREGKELARREEEVKGLVERESELVNLNLEIEGHVEVEGWGGVKGENDNEVGVRGGGVRVRNGGREESVRKEEDGSEEREEVVGRIKREHESGYEDEDQAEVKYEGKVGVKAEAINSQNKWVEEIELLNGSAAWKWLDPCLAVEI